ncbi:MAG: AAA family ATPase, partial [Chloroflexi bacterium]|nr:AAA family ATPase [Chloroflexota bacterium]
LISANHLLQLDPWREEAHRQLMQLLAHTNQTSAALKQYERCRHLLTTELGISPSPATTDLYKTIKAGTHSPAYPSNRTLHTRSPLHNLPHQLTPFIGRETELVELDAYLADEATRLISIVGSGGMGKTRLALSLAQRQLTTNRFPDGVFFVPLAALQDPAHIISAIGQSVNLPMERGRQKRTPKQQLIDFLQNKRQLLLLDNFEHLLRAATLPADLLHAAPHLQIVVTSRERLRLYEEQLYPLDGLTYPTADTAVSTLTSLDKYTAPQLFLERSRRLQPQFTLTETAVPSLATLCQLVAGLPLALELAAGWTVRLSIAAIVAEIKQGLSILETDLRNVPSRHRSITAVFDTSWQHLTQSEQQILVQLSIFRGGFTEDAANTIVGASSPRLQHLTQKSLLQWDGENGRYHIHELLRQYLQQQLDTAQTADDHATYFCQMVADLSPDNPNANAVKAETLISSDLDNIRAAWQHATISLNAPLLSAASFTLAHYYDLHGLLQEGEQLFHMGVTAVSNHAAKTHTIDDQTWEAWATLLTAHSIFVGWLGDIKQSVEMLHEANAYLDNVQQLDVRYTRATTLGWLGDKYNRLGKRVEAWQSHKQSVALYRIIENQYQLGFSLCSLGATSWHLGEYAQATPYLQESLALLEPLGATKGLSRTYFWLGSIAGSQGDYATDKKMTHKSIEVLQTLGKSSEASIRLSTLGYTLALQGRFAESEPILWENIDHLTQIGWQAELVWIRPLLVHTLLHLGKYTEALEVATISLDECTQAGNNWSAGRTLQFAAAAHLAQGNNTDADACLSQSRHLLQKSGNREILANTLALQVYAALATGNGIKQPIADALKLIIDTHTYTPLLVLLPALAQWQIQIGAVSNAAALHALIKQYEYIAQSAWFTDMALSNLEHSLKDSDLSFMQDVNELDLWETAVTYLEMVDVGNGRFPSC